MGDPVYRAARAHCRGIAPSFTNLLLLQDDLEHIRARMAEGHTYSVILKNEYCSHTYGLEFMANLYREEGKGSFSVRTWCVSTAASPRAHASQ